MPFFFYAMASPAETERELLIERTRAGLEVPRQLGGKVGRKRQMRDSKIKSAKKLIASGVPPREVASNPRFPRPSGKEPANSTASVEIPGSSQPDLLLRRAILCDKLTVLQSHIVHFSATLRNPGVEHQEFRCDLRLGRQPPVHRRAETSILA